MADNKVNFLRGTSAEYETKTKDNDTFYYTTDTKKLYLGENEVGNGIDPKVIQAHIDNQTIHAKVWKGTQEEYNAIEPKEDDTVYIIKDSDNTLADKLIDDTSTTATDKTWSAKKINENDEVARTAINTHAGNDEIHVTAAEKEKWNDKAELSDIPTTLPADGGNADTLDGLHANVFFNNIAGLISPETSGKATLVEYIRTLDSATSNFYASNFDDLPTNNWGYNVTVYKAGGAIYVIAYKALSNSEIYVRNFTVSGEWDGDWTRLNDGGNADTLDGKHASDFADNIYKGYPTEGNCNNATAQGVYTVSNNSTNAPGSDFYTLIVDVAGDGTWIVQNAISAGTESVAYRRTRINGNWGAWKNIADGGNAATVNGYTVNANIPAGFSPIGQNTENKTYTYKEKTYTGSNTSEVFNDYTNNMAADTYSHAEGNQTKALGSCSHAEGYNTKALGSHSHAEGYSTKASAPWSHAEGYSTQASAPWSHAEGYSTTTSGDTSHAEGFGTTASGTCSHAEGEVTTASSYASHACGKFNKAMSDSTSKESNVGDVFVIGNGIADNNLSNAFRITYTGATYGLSAFNSSGADYAEFIKPWHDNNIDNEDRVGYFVTIKNGLLYKANEGDYIVGITSGNPSVVGNADEDYYWRYERDEFNRFVYEDAEEEVEQLDDDGAPVLDENGMPVMVKTGNIIKNAHYKLAADYDPTKQNDYIERKNRPEWSYVGMIGVLPVRDDGTCVAGGFAKCGQNGIATRAESRGFDTFFVIERISDNVVSVEIR